MRQVFTSPRLENVESVAGLLREQGIEVRITNDRSYRGNRRSSFSYRDQEEAAPQPAVWIVNADEQPRARQLLRAGKAFDRMDANKDGTLTRAEFDAARSLRSGDRSHSRKH